MRVFLAIDLPMSIKESLNDQLTDLRKKYPEFTWVDYHNFHITVHFFGEIENPTVLSKRIKDLFYDQFHFYLYSTHMGVFIKNKITVYLGFRREKKLESLVNKLTDGLSINVTNKYIPHLSIARYRIPSKQQYFVIKKLIEKQQVEIEFPVKKVVLYQSILDNNRPTYKKIDQYPLI